VASLMTLSTVFVQVVFKRFQAAHQVDSMQLLYYVMPMSGIAQFFTLPMTEDVTALRSFNYQTEGFMRSLLASGALAFCVNLSGFLVIGKATPVTYNVVTHCKTVVVILGGFVLFGSPLMLKNFFGIMVTLSGAISYSYFNVMGPANTDKVVQIKDAEDENEDIEAQLDAPAGQRQDGEKDTLLPDDKAR